MAERELFLKNLSVFSVNCWSDCLDSPSPTPFSFLSLCLHYSSVLLLFFSIFSSLCVLQFPLCTPFPFSSLICPSCLALNCYIHVLKEGLVAWLLSLFCTGSVSMFLIQFVVSSLCRWISTSAGWMPTWRGLKQIWRINWRAATSKALDHETWKVCKCYEFNSLFQHWAYLSRGPWVQSRLSFLDAMV